jgi:peroxiredoxin
MSELINRFAPDFTLPALSGGRLSLSDWRGQFVVMTFWSAECPWSRRADVLLVYRSLNWSPKGVRILGVASNADETDLEILHEAENRGVKYPIVLDIERSVADTYKAQTTPHFFVIDRRGVIRYAGALDDANFKQPKPKILYLDRAVSALLDNRNPEPAVTLPFGSSIVRVAPTPDSRSTVQVASASAPAAKPATNPPKPATHPPKPPTNPPGKPSARP